MVLKIIDHRKSNTLSGRDGTDRKDSTVIERSVAEIIRTVRRNGDSALRMYTRKFDGAAIGAIRIPLTQIEHAGAGADDSFVRILKEAASNIRKFHTAQLRKPFTLKERDNSQLRQIYRPMEKVGVYVPGGKAAYPSTVLMNVIPAQVAGVSEIHLVTPPDKNGIVHPDVLLAASLLGVENVYRVGGAHAIAALTFGTRTIPSVDKIVGPGNIFVATAKKLVYGTVGIDSFAGPSEVVVLADGTADASFIASDLLAQAEHDERAVPILITPSSSLAVRVQKEVERLLQVLPRRGILERSLKGQGRIYLVASLAQGIALTNAFAPEHLEIVTSRDEFVLKQIRHAGSVFLGKYSPVAVGDYFAGPNHVLPTEGTARFSSPLSVDDFIKRSSVIRYSAKRMTSVAEKVAQFAEHEGLAAHALSLRMRKRKI
jgi:histidinol dehydrogenase